METTVVGYLNKNKNKKSHDDQIQRSYENELYVKSLCFRINIHEKHNRVHLYWC